MYYLVQNYPIAPSWTTQIYYIQYQLDLGANGEWVNMGPLVECGFAVNLQQQLPQEVVGNHPAPVYTEKFQKPQYFCRNKHTYSF